MLLTNEPKWCHLRWHTYHKRKLFKIAATARFCERVLLDAGAPQGWTIDAVAVGDDDIQLLVQVPAAVPREEIPARLKQATLQALARARIVAPWRRHVWDDRHWCAVLTNVMGLAAVRRHIQARSRVASGVRLAIVAERPGMPDRSQ
jgi:REP element-mobilizing transposase RayT